MKYSGGDHHIEGLTTFIGKITPGLGKITWKGIGVLADEGHDKAYGWTYYYTFVAWNDYKLQAAVRSSFPGSPSGDGDMDGYCNSHQPDVSDNIFWTDNVDTTTALSSFPSCLQNINLTSGKAAVLPRGFGFRWGSDHHLLQVTYNLDYSEFVIQNQPYRKDFGVINPLSGPSARAGNGFVSWNSYAIFKDDSDRRNYSFGEVVLIMGGRDVYSIQIPFSILPFTPVQGGFGGAGVKTKDVVIDYLPYDYAIPMLTG